MNINHYVEEFTNLWNESENSFPSLGREIFSDEKMKREVEIEQYAKTARNELNFKKPDETGKKRLMLMYKQNLAAFFKNIFNFESDELSILSGKGFTSATADFMRMARRFDPGVKMEDVFQAGRNLWIINTLQLLMNEPVRVTPSVFAYSMLYPYSDNYLDNPDVSWSEKLSFSARFGKRLKGEAVLAANEHERMIFELVSLIESDWDRVEYPLVYESLLAIHDAQTRSISLVNKKENISEGELLSICIEKGGTSVLADGYLINGKLTAKQEWFCFGFGTLLQFVDDIQDIKEDIDGQLVTMFTSASKTSRLEEFTNRSLSFTSAVLSDLTCFSSSEIPSIQRLMTKSVNIMVNEAVGLNDSCFSPEYVLRFEKFSPFSYSFIKKRRSNIDPNRISVMKKIESYVFSNEELAIEVS